MKSSMGEPEEFNHREARLFRDNTEFKRINHDLIIENNRLKFRLGNYEKSYAGYTVVYITEEPNAQAYYIQSANSIEDAKQQARARFVGDALGVFVFKGKSLPL